jgi:hypothetical protein
MKENNDMVKNALDIQNLNNQCEQLNKVVIDLKDQIKATNVELVAVRLEVTNLKIEAKDLRFAIDLLKESLKPLQRFYIIASGVIITAIAGALITLIIIKP